MLKWSFLLGGLATFLFSYKLFRANKEDKMCLKVYGMIAFISISFAIIGAGGFISPYLKTFGFFESVFIYILLAIIAHFLLKPGFKK